MANAIQQRFLQLLHATTALFTTQHGSSKEERSAFDSARAGALALASEAKQPLFENFLAYLLGVTSIDGDYPLQAIRMLALTAQVMSRQTPAADVNLEDLYTAAFMADLGFRPSWIGQKGSHAEVTAYRIKGIAFPWFTPMVEKLVIGHHHFASDASPQHCLSLIARYLGLVYDLGTDDTSNNRVAPSKALEIVLQEHPSALGNMKFILKSISAFPLGSWVLLSTGDPAFVVGANPDNPLRPKVGYCRKSKTGIWVWEEHLLQNEPTVHVNAGLAPTPLQQSFVNQPHLWMKGWDGQGTFSDAEFSEMFRRHTEQPKGSEKMPPSVPAATEPVWMTRPAVPAGSLESSAPGPLTPNVSDKELQKLRTEWENNVHHIEECVTKLKTGLIESYRRENERYRETLEQLTKNPPAAPTMAVHPALAISPGVYEETAVHPPTQTQEPAAKMEEVSSPLLKLMEGKIKQLESEMDSRDNQFKSQNEDLQKSFDSLKAFLEKYLSAVTQLPAVQAAVMRNVIRKAQVEMESAEQGLWRTVRLPIASLNELRVQWESARTLIKKFQEELGQGTHAASKEDIYARLWKESTEPQLDKWRQTVERDWADRLERWARLKQLTEQFQDLADLLKDKFPGLD